MRGLLLFLALAAGAFAQTTCVGCAGSGGGSVTIPDPPSAVLFNDGGALGGSATHIHTSAALPVPAAPTLSGPGASGGATTWGYQLVARNLIGGSAPSTQSTATSGKATLTGTDYIRITPPACAAAVTSYDVYRTSSGNLGSAFGDTGMIKANLSCASTFDDIGGNIILPFYSPPSADNSIGIGSSAPLINTNSGSAFGSLAQANNDASFLFGDASTGLGVFEHTANPAYDYITFLVNTVVDADKAVNTTVFQSNIFTNLNYAPLNNITSTIYEDGTVTSTVPITNFKLNTKVFGTTGGYVTQFQMNPQVGTIPNDSPAAGLYGFYETAPDISGSIPQNFGIWIGAPTGTITATNYAFYAGDQGAVSAPSSYYEWYDSRGVFRIKEDNSFNSVGQAIASLYNPQFTKYTPGAVNFERSSLRWNSNVLEIGAEAGGTGVLRRTRLIGKSAQLPSGSSDPGCSGSGDIGNFWLDTTTTTTAVKVCKSVSGTVGWSTLTTTP